MLLFVFSVELFEKTCGEARDWMTEKMDKLDGAEVGLDLKTIQALQRRHLNLERELAPVEEKVNRVNLLANSVKVSYPNEKGEHVVKIGRRTTKCINKKNRAFIDYFYFSLQRMSTNDKKKYKCCGKTLRTRPWIGGRV